MAEREQQPGLEALLECNFQVEISIRNHLDHAAKFLKKVGIIDLKLLIAVTDPTSREPADNRARMVYQRLQAMVEEDEKYYKIFVEYLHNHPDKYKNTTSMLDEAYVNNGGILSSASEAKSHFSDKFSAAEFADWMNKSHDLPEDSCKTIKDEGITGKVFLTLTEEDMKELGFNFGARRTMISVLKEVKAEPVSKAKYKPPVQSQEIQRGSRTELDEKHHSQLCEQLVPVKFAWENIAISLGFLPHEIESIRRNWEYGQSGNHIFKVIELYLRWAPGDGRGSKDIATLEALQVALNKNNFAKLKLKITS